MSTFSRIVLSIASLIILILGVTAIFLTQNDNVYSTPSQPQSAAYLNFKKIGD